MTRCDHDIAHSERLNCELEKNIEPCSHLLEDCRSLLTEDSRMDSEQFEGSYFAGRERFEREMTRQATSASAAAVHKELAERYEALAVVFGAKSSPHARTHA